MYLLLVTTNRYMENFISVIYATENIGVIPLCDGKELNDFQIDKNCIGIILALKEKEWRAFDISKQVIEEKPLSVPVMFVGLGENDEGLVKSQKSTTQLLKPFFSFLNHHTKELRQPLSLAPDVVWDIEHHYIVKGENKYFLSDMERKILSLLTKKVGEVFSPEDILEYTEIVELSSLYVHINNIRKKIEDNPKKPTVLITQRGKGYYIEYHKVSYSQVDGIFSASNPGGD